LVRGVDWSRLVPGASTERIAAGYIGKWAGEAGKALQKELPDDYPSPGRPWGTWGGRKRFTFRLVDSDIIRTDGAFFDARRMLADIRQKRTDISERAKGRDAYRYPRLRGTGGLQVNGVGGALGRKIVEAAEQASEWKRQVWEGSGIGCRRHDGRRPCPPLAGRHERSAGVGPGDEPWSDGSSIIDRIRWLGRARDRVIRIDVRVEGVLLSSVRGEVVSAGTLPEIVRQTGAVAQSAAAEGVGTAAWIGKNMDSR
jgi:hypothetical protein